MNNYLICLKKYLSGVLSVFFLVVTSANAETTLSLQGAINLALTNNEKLRQAEEDRQSAVDRVREARGALFPKLEASYKYSRYFEIREIPQYYNVAPNTGPGGSFIGLVSPNNSLSENNPLGWHTVPQYGPAIEDNEHTAGLTLTQVLFTSGRVTNYLRATKTGREAAENLYNAERHDLVLNVQNAYLDTLLAKQAVVIAEESLDNAEKDHQVIKNKLTEGVASNFDVMQHEVTVQNFHVILNKVQNSFTLAKNHLKTIIVIKFDEDIVLSDTFIGDFPEFNFNSLLEDMKKNEPTLKAIGHHVKANKYILKAKKADYFPVLSAFGSAERSGDSEDFFPDDDELDDTIVAGINLTIPIYEGGIKQSKVSQAVHDLKKSELEYDKIAKLLRLDLQNAFLTYLSSQRELETADKTVRVAQKAYELATLRYDTGMGSRSDLEDASLGLSNARLQYYMFKRNVNHYLYKIFRYCPGFSRSK